MGCSNSCDCDQTDVLNAIFSQLYDLFKQMIINLKDTNEGTLNNIYLISIKSIPKFIKPIEESNILKDLEEGKENEIILNEKKLKKDNQNYQPENNIKIYADYKICKSISENNNDENEFIIVNTYFLEKMIEDKDIYKNKAVNLIFNKKESIMKIKFSISGFTIKIKEKRLGIYEFIKEENNNDNKNTDFK